MPGAPAATDYNDDGYLDVAYIGDVNGHMWRIDLTPDIATSRGLYSTVDRQVHNYKPFLLYDGCGVTPGACTKRFAPVFMDPGIVFLGGSIAPPGLGIAFGTGNRADLVNPKPLSDARSQNDSFLYVVDTGQTAKTFVRADLRDVSPSAGNGPCPLPPSACETVPGNGILANGFALDFATLKETTTSTAFSTQGYLSLVTFTADSPSPCANNGSSFRYVFFFLTGQGKYGTAGTYADFQQDLGTGVAAVSQSTSPQGDIIDTVLFSGGAVRQDVTAGSVRTIDQNWKEQQ
jgi:Tfp pilus tip-associated adhesin PilY1